MIVTLEFDENEVTPQSVRALREHVNSRGTETLKVVLEELLGWIDAKRAEPIDLEASLTTAIMAAAYIHEHMCWLGNCVDRYCDGMHHTDDMGASWFEVRGSSA